MYVCMRAFAVSMDAFPLCVLDDGWMRREREGRGACMHVCVFLQIVLPDAAHSLTVICGD